MINVIYEEAICRKIFAGFEEAKRDIWGWIEFNYYQRYVHI
ncbi:MAG: hypothetical protein NUV74_01545 [Candidatus Brocadiaceae bacterium]|nr:hypothetical protein [Candidatus Brocadiaceae bacterium]